MTVTDPHRSPLWSGPTLGRHLELLDVSFDETHRAAKALGGSINDLFVAATVAGAGRLPPRARASTSTSSAWPCRSAPARDGSAGGNSFVPTRVLVPAADVDPVDPLRSRCTSVLGRTKAERAIGLVAGLAGVANLLPTSVLVRVARQQAETVDFTTSNLRAAPFDLYIAGRPHRGHLPDGAAGRHGLQPHDDVLPRRCSTSACTSTAGMVDRRRRCSATRSRKAFAELIAAGT